jgi:hypothetical protein
LDKSRGASPAHADEAAHGPGIGFVHPVDLRFHLSSSAQAIARDGINIETFPASLGSAGPMTVRPVAARRPFEGTKNRRYA